MSIPVALEELTAAMVDHDYAYLLTNAVGGGPHAVAVQPRCEASVVLVDGVGRRTRDNALARPEVTLVWPPREPGGYSLIVDGLAVATSTDELRVTPQRAVLHRPAPGTSELEADGTGCGSDCVELPLDGASS